MRYALAIAGLAVAAQAGGNTYTLTATEEVTITSCAPTHTNCPYKSASNEWENWGKPADPATTTSAWGEWDPSKPSTTPKKSSTTWADWDPSKPKVTTTSIGTWADWDPSKPKVTTTSTSAWGEWDPSKPATTTKPSNGDNGNWNDWSNGSDGKKTTSSKPSTATGVNGDWNNWGSASATSSKPVSNTAACPSYTATAPPAWFSQLPSAVLSSLAAQWTGAPPKDWCYYSYSTSSMATKTPDAAANGDWNNWGAATSTPVKGASATGSGPVAKYTGAANANAASFVLGGAAAIAAVILV